MTGVSPIVMNDMGSGANTNQDITWDYSLNQLCGFSQQEVRSMLEHIADDCGFSKAKVVEVSEQMRLFYNGSRFATHNPRDSQATIPKVYNPILSFYFLKYLHRTCAYPETMLDNNLAPDYNKLVYVSRFPEGRELLSEALHTGVGCPLSILHQRWSIREMLDDDKSKEYLSSLLTYFGAFTIAGRSEYGDLILEIPNLVMRQIYAEYLLKSFFDDERTRRTAQQQAVALFSQGDMTRLCNFVEQHLLSIYDNRDYKSFNELSVKTLFIALLYNTPQYIITSESAVDSRYVDLLFLIRPEKRYANTCDILIEFKYLSLKQLGHLSGKTLKTLSEGELWELEPLKASLTEAREQIKDYQESLYKKHTAQLKLCSFVVIALGLERLLCVEVGV